MERTFRALTAKVKADAFGPLRSVPILWGLAYQEHTNRLLANPFTKETCAPAKCGRFDEVGANRKGSWRPACHWCSTEPFRSLVPQEPTLSLMACVILAGRGTTPITRLIICVWILRPASGSTT